jgi:high-affinity nickel permease
MLFLKQKIENNFFSHNLTTNSKNTTNASPLVTRRLGKQKKAFPCRSKLFSLIKKFSVIKFKNYSTLDIIKSMWKKPNNHAIFFFINHKISCLLSNFYLLIIGLIVLFLLIKLIFCFILNFKRLNIYKVYKK